MENEQSNKQLEEFFTVLGLAPRQIKTYLYLVKLGTITALELSRKTEIPRSTLYRIIASLKQKGLVEEVVEEYVVKVQAAPLSHVEYLVAEEKSKADSLVSLFPNIRTMIANTQSVSQPDTKVLMYRGREGIRQMVWNVLDATSEVAGYTYRLLDEFVGARFMNRWREESRTRKIKGRDILTEEYYRSIKGREKDIDWSNWKIRYMPEKTLAIGHQLDIYNSVTAVYNWHDGEVFGIEIHNEKVAKMQKQIFEIVWKVASPVTLSRR